MATRWLPGMLWGLTLAVAAALLILVLLAPFLTGNGSPSQVVVLFASDATVRRTALASAIGLLVTACVFFRSPPALPDRPAKRTERTPPPPIVGA